MQPHAAYGIPLTQAGTPVPPESRPESLLIRRRRWQWRRIRSTARSTVSAMTRAVLGRAVEFWSFESSVRKRAYLVNVTPVQGTQRLANIWLHTGSRAIGCTAIRTATGPHRGNFLLETFVQGVVLGFLIGREGRVDSGARREYVRYHGAPDEPMAWRRRSIWFRPRRARQRRPSSRSNRRFMIPCFMCVSLLGLLCAVKGQALLVCAGD